MVEADLVDKDAPGLDAEQRRGEALEPDRHVAEPDGAVPCVEQAARDDPDRVREVDDPGVVGGELAHPGGDVEHDRDGSQGLAEPAGAGRLLADAATGERDRLVQRRACCPPTRSWIRTKEAPSSARSRSSVTESFAVVAGRVEHAGGEAADDLAALGVDVVQNDVGQVEPLPLTRQPGDQLRGVGRATADDGELHCWTPTVCRAATSESCQEP